MSPSPYAVRSTCVHSLAQHAVLVSTPPALYTVGRIIAPWGIRGDVTIEILSDNPKRFASGAHLLLEAAGDVEVERLREISGKPVLKLRGVDTRNDAEALRGRLLQVPEADLMVLPPGTYFHHQILGLQVETVDGARLGTVDEIFPTGSNDVYVVKAGAREYLIPAIADVVKQIDLDSGRIVIDPMPGLLD